jgi:hypothetical protein
MKGCCQVPALVLLHHHGTVITDVFMGSSGSDFHMHALRKLLKFYHADPPRATFENLLDEFRFDPAHHTDMFLI